MSSLAWRLQDLQDEVARESEELQQLQAQRQKVQQALEELDEQKGSLEEQLTHIRQQTSQETQLVGLVEFSFYSRFIYFSTGKHISSSHFSHKNQFFCVIPAFS